MTRCLLALVLVIAAFGGCLGADDVVEPTGSGIPAPTPAGLVAHAAAGVVPLPAGFEELTARISYVGENGPEPTLGVTSDGTIFITAGGNGAGVARSTDNGRSWQVIATPTSHALTPKASLDPWLWVDPLTDRVFNAPLYVACTWMSWSDDGGDSWLAAPHAGCGLPAHDHQKLTTGPPAEGVTTMGYPNVLYYVYNSFRGEGNVVSVSYDGGLTWSPGTAIHPPDCVVGASGGIGVAPDGTAYSAKPTCEGVNIAVSHDSGRTWAQSASINGAGIQAPGQTLITNPDLDTDPSGNVYLGFTGADGGMYLTTSQDQGATWTEPVRAAPPRVTVTAFSVIAVGTDGRVALGYLGTTADPGDWETPSGHHAPDDTVWHLYLSFTDDALSADPTFATIQVTPDEDPVQVGCIWLAGGGNPCRNMLDFVDMVERGGRTYMAFADGCDKCDSADASRGRAAAVAIVETGPSLTGGMLSPLVTE